MRRQLDGTLQCCLLKQAKQEIEASMYTHNLTRLNAKQKFITEQAQKSDIY